MAGLWAKNQTFEYEAGMLISMPKPAIHDGFYIY